MLVSLWQIKTDLFGKNGLVSSQFKKIGTIEESKRKKFASDLNIIKDELVKLFTEESIEGIQEKLKTPIDSEFMNGDFSKSGGKTRKRKRKNRKKTLKRKTKKRKGKRRKTRRKKRRSTRKRGKH